MRWYRSSPIRCAILRRASIHFRQAMCYIATMKTALVLLLAVSPAYACDWKVSKATDSMTDKTVCTVSSEAANLSFVVRGNDRPNIVVDSPFRAPWVYVRVDDAPAASMGTNAYSRDKALTALLPQLETGQRIRVRYQNHPSNTEGDAPICDLPRLLRECSL